MYFSYLVVLFYCHFIWFYLTCLNLINGDKDGDVRLWHCVGQASEDFKLWVTVDTPVT